MLFSESRYDFQRCLWSDIWDSIKAVGTPKGLGAHHPKSRTTVSLRGFIIHISAYRKKHDRRVTILRPTFEQDPFRSGWYCKLFLGCDAGSGLKNHTDEGGLEKWALN
jgi:hypothetical protein